MNFKSFYLTESFQYYKEVILKYKDTDDVYFSFTNIFKIGINPKSTWNTPVGIYTYPTNIRKIPFFGSSVPNYAWFITPKKSARCFDFDNYTETRYKKDLENISLFFKNEFPR